MSKIDDFDSAQFDRYELRQRIKELEARIAELESQLAAQREQIERLLAEAAHS